MLDLSKCKPEYLQYKTYHNRHKSDCRNIFNYEHFLIWLINSSQSKQAASLNKNLGLETLWRRQWHPTPVLLPGKSHGWRSLVGCSPWGRWESDTTERLHFHFPLSCIGEGNGNPLQCSCLENPRDGGAWWAAVYGVAQGRTRLKRLSSSSRNTMQICYDSSLRLFHV